MAKFNIIVEKDEDEWFVSEVIELPGCHTQAKTMDELIARTKEAIQSYLEIDEFSEPLSKFIELRQIGV